MKRCRLNPKFLAASFFLVSLYFLGTLGISLAVLYPKMEGRNPVAGIPNIQRNAVNNPVYELNLDGPVKIIEDRFQWMLEIKFNGKLFNGRNGNMSIEAAVFTSGGEPLKDLDGISTNDSGQVAARLSVNDPSVRFDEGSQLFSGEIRIPFADLDWIGSEELGLRLNLILVEAGRTLVKAAEPGFITIPADKVPRVWARDITLQFNHTMTSVGPSTQISAYAFLHTHKVAGKDFKVDLLARTENLKNISAFAAEWMETSAYWNLDKTSFGQVLSPQIWEHLEDKGTGVTGALPPAALQLPKGEHTLQIQFRFFVDGVFTGATKNYPITFIVD
ncbi:MAG: hypothetical protein MUP70_14830 [Candidatus Aminicenantes bacterium]|nr:hypothetical protein [Candidatus Aminicenantes bacterium]